MWERVRAWHIFVAGFVLLLISCLCFIGSTAAGVVLLLLALLVMAGAVYKWYYYERNTIYSHQSHSQTTTQRQTITVP
jgi:hypothetical protein